MDISIIKLVVSQLISAPIFFSDEEVETMTGYSLDEYRQLSWHISAFNDISELRLRDAAMIEQASETLRSVPNYGREIYENIFGPDYESILGEVSEAMNARLGTGQ